MFRTWGIVLLLAGAVVGAGQAPKKHRDYVPDEKTAVRIAEAVLIAQFGEERVNAQLPLRGVTAMGTLGSSQEVTQGRLTKVAAWQ